MPTFNPTAIFAYRIIPTAILAFAAYIAIFISLSVTDTLEDVPKSSNQGGLDLREAYEDLRIITSHPHPYNSHANDRVHSYLLGRLRTIAGNYSHVHIADDMTSNAQWCNPTLGVYFEGTNILVKIDGTEAHTTSPVPSTSLVAAHELQPSSTPSLPGVLFSAHYDSVSTAPGATDDGMGVATILQLVKYFTQNRMRRTAVFNINNGEEDWLNGAHAFLEHPWSNLTDIFLNLEGAAAGGRPILFRATSTLPVRALKSHKLIPHPHANVLSADAFSRGAIKSGTDYSVYVEGGKRGMQGLDLAFYKGRSRYHTKYDAVPFTLGGEKSLWSMMEVARGVGIGLLNRPYDEREVTSTNEGGNAGVNVVRDVDMMLVDGKNVGDTPVYFDLFKRFFIVFPLSNLLTYNIVSLIVGPIILIFFFVCERVLLRREEAEDSSSDSESEADDEAEANAQAQTTGYGATSHRNGHLTQNGNGTGRRRPERSGTTGGYDVTAALEDEDDVDGSDVGGYRNTNKGKWMDILGGAWLHLKLWVAIVVSFGVLMFWVWTYVIINPYAIYASPYLILLSAIALSYLTLTYILALPHSLPFYLPHHHIKLHSASPHHLTPAQQSKHTTFNHLYILTFVLLVLSTLGITKVHPGIGSGYLITVWNTCVGVACVLCAVESGVCWAMRARRGDGYDTDSEDPEAYEELEGERGAQGRRVLEGEEEGAGRHHPLLKHQHQHHHPEAHDESTPLIRSDSAPLPGPSRHVHHAHRIQHRHPRMKEREGWSSVWWIAQMLVSVPIPVILWGGVAMVVLDGMPQGIVDGGEVYGVYVITAVLSLLLTIPLAPFATKLYPLRPLTYLVIGLFVLSTLTTYLSFPFTVEDPLKVFFQQKIQLGNNVVRVRHAHPGLLSNTSQSFSLIDTDTIPPPPHTPTEAIITSSLSGPKRYLRDRIVGVMPSAQHEMRKGSKGSVMCAENEVKKGLERCEWSVPPHMGLDVGEEEGVMGLNDVTASHLRKAWDPKEYFDAEVLRTGPSNATFRVRGRNTRSCRIYFEEPVFWFGVRGGGRSGISGLDEDAGSESATGVKQRMQRGYDVPSKGVKEIRLWGRTWEKEWIVDVDWGYQIAPSKSEDGPTWRKLNELKGRIACEWAEYESGMVDTGPGMSPPERSERVGVRHPKIPAFEEVLSFLPEWAAASKASDGLVEVWAPFGI